MANLILIVLNLIVLFGSNGIVEAQRNGPLGLANNLINRTTFPIFNGISNILNFYQAYRPCQTDLNQTGTCLAKSDCQARQGSISGVCVPGVTVCCDLKLITCGGRTERNETLFVNQQYPLADNLTNTCQITVEKQANVCQLRLDFMEFEIAQPDDNGQCTTDSFMIRTTVGERLPILCGQNSNQHLYIDVGSRFVNSNPVVLSVVTNGADLERKWRIKIQQIPCDSLSMAPSGCLQYFRSSSGHVESFNYGPKIENKSRYLSNLRYTTCIRTEENFCGIKWQTDKTDSFSWGWPFGPGSQRDNLTTLAASGGQCNHDDYIGIDQATPEDNNPYALDEDRFCGMKLMQNDQVFSRSKPFLLKVRSNNDQKLNAEQSQQGFSLRFTQLPCVL